jgi:flagellar motility protein MotE (MotC chaperone)
MADKTRQEQAAAEDGKSAKKSREKKIKPEKPKKGGAEGIGRPQKNRRAGKKKTPLIIFIVAFFLLCAIGLFVFAVTQFDQWGLRTSFIESVNKLDPLYASLASRLAAVDLRETAVAAREEEAAAEEARLEEWNAALRQREVDLDGAERDRIPIYRAPSSPQEVADLESLGKIYAAMTPERAAEILARLYANEDMAAILYYMSEKSAAPILSAMDSRLAADITEILLERWDTAIT